MMNDDNKENTNNTTTKEYVRIRTGDGYEFVVPLEVACVSGTIKNMLRGSGKFMEADSVIRVPHKATSYPPS